MSLHYRLRTVLSEKSHELLHDLVERKELKVREIIRVGIYLFWFVDNELRDGGQFIVVDKYNQEWPVDFFYEADVLDEEDMICDPCKTNQHKKCDNPATCPCQHRRKK